MLCVLFIAGCSSGHATAPPKRSTTPASTERRLRHTPRREPTLVERVPFTVFTHCGIDVISLGDAWYAATPPLNDGEGNPPPGWGNPTDTGELALYSDGSARFTNHLGGVATFHKLPTKPALRGCD